jgi:hypothetical protein
MDEEFVKIAMTAAEAQVEVRQDEMAKRAEQEGKEALDHAQAYAEHLASGGDPTEVQVPHGQGDKLVPVAFALGVVVREWDKARGSINPLMPFGNGASWLMAEHFLANVGTPVSYAEVAEIGKRYSRKASPTEVIDVLMDLERHGATGLIAAKTKVDGKVAYMLREPKEGEEPSIRYRWDFPEE